jgi:alpha-ribazole phosphatase
MRLVLCRHADAGDARQSAALADALARADVAAVYTSPLARALETARVVAAQHGLSPVVHDDLREFELGDLEGLQFDDYPAELQQRLLDTPGSVEFPGGESYERLRERVTHAVADIVARHGGEQVVAVSHAGAIRAALALWLSIPADASFRIDQRFAGVNVVDWVDGIPFIRLVNGARLDG